MHHDDKEIPGESGLSVSKVANRLFASITALALAAMLALTGCSTAVDSHVNLGLADTGVLSYPNVQLPEEPSSTPSEKLPDTPSEVLEYESSPYVELAGGIPNFSDSDLAREPFQSYSELDALGRCGTAFVIVNPASMPEGDRGKIGHIKPTGFVQKEYDFVEGGELYNRCHLMAFQLTGQNDNIQNLITGTRYMNVKGMKPFEDAIARYVKSTGNSVLYRVTPVFQGQELVARGVQLEALSIEDGGVGICTNVYCYNVQPGVEIDYMTGNSWLEGERPPESALDPNALGYVLNTNTMKFHRADCSSAAKISEKNRQSYTTGSREYLTGHGYEPCKICKP